MMQFSFEAEKIFKCDYRGFGRSGGRNVADFLGSLNYFSTNGLLLFIRALSALPAILKEFILHKTISKKVKKEKIKMVS